MSRASLPIVSIVGRPNVGKSTLFNRILRRRQAVVDDAPGVTRDRHMAVTEWEGKPFMLVDTGGLLLAAEGIIEERIREQVEMALGESRRVLFVVDGREGPVADDHDVADLLRRRGADVTLVVTKIDAEPLEAAGHEFAELGVGDLHLVSGLEGRGVADLLDEITADMPPGETADTDGRIAIAVIGRPNVGKSSLVNAMLQRERMIVSEIPGTTRDAIDTDFRYEGRDYTLIDTAGLHRRTKTTRGAEYFSSIRTTRSLERADVAVVVFDATEPLSRQDFRIAAMPFESGRPVLFVFNKWDVVESKETLTSRDIVREAARHVPDFDHAPSEFLSARTTQRVSRVMERIDDVYRAARAEQSAADLDAFIDRVTAAKSHPYTKGAMMRFWGMRQVGVAPPTFIVYCNKPNMVEDNYRRYVKNRLRESFGYFGTPLRVLYRRK